MAHNCQYTARDERYPGQCVQRPKFTRIGRQHVSRLERPVVSFSKVFEKRLQVMKSFETWYYGMRLTFLMSAPSFPQRVILDSLYCEGFDQR
jgi:hypothetical protein